MKKIPRRLLDYGNMRRHARGCTTLVRRTAQCPRSRTHYDFQERSGNGEPPPVGDSADPHIMDTFWRLRRDTYTSCDAT